MAGARSMRKLTDEQVRSIRASNFRLSSKDLSEKFGVSQATIDNVRNRTLYKSVQ